MNAAAPLQAFSGYGVELEYMLVERDTLAVLPIADRLLAAAGGGQGEVRRGAMGWSNELVRHVVEIKNLQPSAALAELPDAFQAEVQAINGLLDSLGARLMPGGMHPFMDPVRETQLWTGEGDAIYRSFDRIFDCRSHGWANLQSMHFNLPFRDDDEFARLHAAVRLLLPILPALAASSPFADGRRAPVLDQRLVAYRDNCARLPSITGAVIPETVTGRADYEARILAPMYREITPLDPDGVLRHDWLNARGAIPRFERLAVEIRVIDVQECPWADLAIAAAAVEALRPLYDGRRATLTAQRSISTEALVKVFDACVRDGELALIDDPVYLALMGYEGSRCEARELWAQLLPLCLQPGTLWARPLSTVLHRGTLARRMVEAAGSAPTLPVLRRVWGELCECLDHGLLFRAD